MIRNSEWVYRLLYGCHYLMSIKTNEILCISPLVGELFIDGTKFNIDGWCKDNNVTEKDKNYLVEFFVDKGVLSYE